MSPERCRTVIKRFIGKELSGPFYQIFESGEQLMFLHHRGDDEEFSGFATPASAYFRIGANDFRKFNDAENTQLRITRLLLFLPPPYTLHPDSKEGRSCRGRRQVK